MSSRLSLLLTLTAAVIAVIPICSQTITASLEGDVKDATGAVVPGAHIHVINTATGVSTRAETGSDGRFVAPYLPPGPY